MDGIYFLKYLLKYEKNIFSWKIQSRLHGSDKVTYSLAEFWLDGIIKILLSTSCSIESLIPFEYQWPAPSPKPILRLIWTVVGPNILNTSIKFTTTPLTSPLRLGYNYLIKSSIYSMQPLRKGHLGEFYWVPYFCAHKSHYKFWSQGQ